MAPLRRRASRRVVKSTFQECFEYDIPGFRSVETKRPSGPLARNRPNTNRKTNLKPESTSKAMKNSLDENEHLTVKKSKTTVDKDKTLDVNLKVQKKTVKTKSSERLVEKIQSSLANRRKVKSTFMGYDYKRFKAPLSNNKIKNKVGLTTKKLPTKPISENNSSAVPELVYESKSWQPVVHLEKIRLDKPKTSKPSNSPDENKVKTRRRHRPKHASLESRNLATRLKNALKDPMAENEDIESESSDKEISNRKLVEVLKETRTIKACSALSHKAQREPEDKVGARKKSTRSSSVEKVLQDDRVSSKHTGSDSALEDWPESSSETSEAPLFKDSGIDEMASSSAMTDWASPHVSLILDWQKQFSSVTNDLKSSFDSLKSIIEEKNSLISALKNKLDCYNENTCHKILERILLDYDKHDPKNPATVIINSILDYPNSNC